MSWHLLRSSPLFNRCFYLQQNPDVANTEIDPLEHYLNYGGFEGRNPHPLFDSSFYLQNNPEIADKRENPLVHFLAQGARQGLDPHPLFSIRFYLEQAPELEELGVNPLIHYLERGAREGLDPHPLFNSAFYLQQLAGEHKETDFNALEHYLARGAKMGLRPGPQFDGDYYYQRYPDVREASINPLLHYAQAGQLEGRQARRYSSIADGARSIEKTYFQEALTRLLDVTVQPFSHMIVIPCLLRGGYERCLANFARAIALKMGLENVLVLVTDIEEMTCLDWLPEQTRIVNLVKLEPSLSHYEKGHLILELLARRKPAVTIGMNSTVILSALDRHIDTWRDEIASKIVTYLGSYEPYVLLNNCGFNDGPLYRLMESLDLIVTDNVRLKDAAVTLHNDNSSISSKVFACYKCLDEDLHRRLTLQGNSTEAEITDGQPQTADQASKTILWASRLDELKRLDVLAAIARQMPDVQFDVYGRASAELDLAFLRTIENICLKGEYDNFATIAKENIAALLYTSKADGMPHVLLEAGACGLPVIAPEIGGIGELISDNTGWLLAANDDVPEYVTTIRYVLDHPETARARADNLKMLINERHSWRNFLDRLEKLDIWEPRRSIDDDMSSSQQLGEPGDEAVVCNPLVHYLTAGAELRLNPSPIFDGDHYKKRYPDVAAAGIDPLLHFTSAGQSEGRMGRRLSSIASGALHIKDRAYQSALVKLQQATLEPFSHLFVVDSLTRGGISRCASNFYQAVCRGVGASKILILITDEEQMTCTDWLPDEVRLVNLLELEPSLSSDERAVLLLELLCRARPRVALCFNSPTFWNAVDYHADVCRKELSTRLVAYLGGYEDYVDYNGWGFNHGSINRLASVLDLFITDNERLRSVMIDLHSSVPSIEQRVVTCYKSLTDDLLHSLQQKDACRNSASSGMPLSLKASSEKGKILWASRLDRVKQPEVLAGIARHMRDVQFEVYGRCMPGIDVSYLDEIPNVSLCGEYSDFSSISTNDKAAFLHTSKSDSMPHVLIEAAVCGLPVIAPHIGAIGELIDDKTGWLVEDSGNCSGYVDAIGNVLANPREAQQRASRLKALINERHTWSAFLTRVEKLDIW